MAPVGRVRSPLLLDQGEVGLVLLGEVETEHGFQPVQGPTQLADLILGGPAVCDFGEETTHSPGEVGDLDVGPAHGRRRVCPAQGPIQGRVQLSILGLLVRCQLPYQKPVGGSDERHGLADRKRPKTIGSPTQPVDPGPQGGVLVPEPSRQLVGSCVERDLAGRRAHGP